MDSLDQTLDQELRQLEAMHLRRHLRNLDGPQGPIIPFDGREVVNFSSNDYLGLAGEPFLIAAFQKAAADFGAGAGASRLLSGNQPPHRLLEEAIACFKRTEAALAFSCGYSTALGTIPALVGRDDVVILDKLSHACLVDGARLSGATLRVFPHNDLDKLNSHLSWARNKFPRGRILILTESVFSMDGDLAPLAGIVALKNRFDAWLLVDEAHGIGVIGPEGRGLVDTLGLGSEVEVQMGTLGKAIGSAGGYISGSRSLIDLIINRGRSFIFSTAPPPAQAAASCCAVQWLQSKEGRERVAALTQNRKLLPELCPDVVPETPPSAIVPILIGEEDATLALAKRLLDAGLFLPAVRYPTVPKNKARLRLTLTAKHRREHLEALATANLSRCQPRGGPL